MVMMILTVQMIFLLSHNTQIGNLIAEGSAMKFELF